MPHRIFVIFLLSLLTPSFAGAAPVYIHMNGDNYFLEPVVAARPGEAVVFVNQDTDGHTIVGYNPTTGALSPRFDKVLLGTRGPGHKIDSYAIRFAEPGLEPYFCSVHAELKPMFGTAAQPVKRTGTDGFKGPMAGLIIVTTDPALIAENPPTTATKIVNGFFGD